MSKNTFNLNNQISSFHAESKEDYISLSHILGNVGEFFSEISESEKAAFGIIRGLLALGLKAGDLTNDNGFAPWPDQRSDAVIDRITREKQARGHDPSTYDHTWFHLPG